MLLELGLEIGNAAVLDLARLGVVSPALGDMKLVPEGLDLLVDLLRLADLLLLLLPAGLEPRGGLLGPGEFLLELGKALLASRILLLAEGLALHLEHHDLALHLVDLGRHRLDLDLEA